MRVFRCMRCCNLMLLSARLSLHFFEKRLSTCLSSTTCYFKHLTVFEHHVLNYLPKSQHRRYCWPSPTMKPSALRRVTKRARRWILELPWFHENASCELCCSQPVVVICSSCGRDLCHDCRRGRGCKQCCPDDDDIDQKLTSL